MVKNKRACFTLLELLIVLLIISFGISLTGIKVRDLYLEQCFLSESQQILSHLAMAQDLMLIMDTDVQVNMAKDPKTQSIQLWLEVEKPLKSAWANFVERKIQLKAIKAYQFGDTSPQNLTLQFSLGKMSRGLLKLFDQNDLNQSEKRSFDIELVGYPSPIGQQVMPQKSPNLYPSEVYEELYPPSAA